MEKLRKENVSVNGLRLILLLIREARDIMFRWLMIWHQRKSSRRNFVLSVIFQIPLRK